MCLLYGKDKTKPSTFKNWALAGQFSNHLLYIRSSEKRCHLPANQHCSYSSLTQLRSTVWLAVLHRLHMCLTEPCQLSTVRFQAEKCYTNILPPILHLTQGSTCVEFLLMVGSKIQLIMYIVIWKYTPTRICSFTPNCDKAT